MLYKDHVSAKIEVEEEERADRRAAAAKRRRREAQAEERDIMENFTKVFGPGTLEHLELRVSITGVRLVGKYVWDCGHTQHQVDIDYTLPRLEVEDRFGLDDPEATAHELLTEALDRAQDPCFEDEGCGALG